MNPLNHKVLFSALGLVVLAGCASTTPDLDSKFGHAVNAAKAQQTLNPDASKNRDPVAGVDGKTAKETVDRYHDTFKAPPPTFSVININTGGAGQ